MDNSARNGILAAGNWIVDHVKLIDAYPDQDALAFISSQSSANGGGPYNVLKDLAKLGAEFPLCGAGVVGDDENGRWILADCESHRIDTAQIKVTADAPTSYTDVMSVADSGRRTFFHQVGANALFTGEHLDLSANRARFFYLGYLLLLEALDRLDDEGQTGAARLLRGARAAGIETVVDLVSAQKGKFRELVSPALPETDTLLLNEFEAGALLGREVEPGSAESLSTAARDVLALGVRQRVIVHSEFGAVAVSAGGDQAVHGSVAIGEDEIRGAAGAGDAFAAGVILGLHGDRPLAECLRIGVCSAAGCLGDPTTSGGVLNLEGSLALGERLGFRRFV